MSYSSLVFFVLSLTFLSGIKSQPDESLTYTKSAKKNESADIHENDTNNDFVFEIKSDLNNISIFEVSKYLYQFGYFYIENENLLDNFTSHEQKELLQFINNITSHVNNNETQTSSHNDTQKINIDNEILQKFLKKYEQNLLNAIRMFQKVNNLNVTGTITTEMVELLQQPRCGVSDIDLVKNMYNETSENYKRRKRYDELILFDERARWTHSHLTWKLHTYTVPNYLYIDDLRYLIKKSFYLWNKYLYRKTDEEILDTDSRPANINIYFGSLEHGDGFPFDGPSYTLAHAFKPKMGKICMDSDELWETLSDPHDDNYDYKRSFFTIFTHELGHALGLDHLKVHKAIMRANYYYVENEIEQLPGSDQLAITDLYNPSMRTSYDQNITFDDYLKKNNLTNYKLSNKSITDPILLDLKSKARVIFKKSSASLWLWANYNNTLKNGVLQPIRRIETEVFRENSKYWEAVFRNEASEFGSKYDDYFHSIKKSYYRISSKRNYYRQSSEFVCPINIFPDGIFSVDIINEASVYVFDDTDTIYIFDISKNININTNLRVNDVWPNLIDLYSNDTIDTMYARFNKKTSTLEHVFFINDKIHVYHNYTQHQDYPQYLTSIGLPINTRIIGAANLGKRTLIFSKDYFWRFNNKNNQVFKTRRGIASAHSISKSFTFHKYKDAYFGNDVRKVLYYEYHFYFIFQNTHYKKTKDIYLFDQDFVDVDNRKDINDIFYCINKEISYNPY